MPHCSDHGPEVTCTRCPDPLAERDRYREALEEIAESPYDSTQELQTIAREALDG